MKRLQSTTLAQAGEPNQSNRMWESTKTANLSNAERELLIDNRVWKQMNLLEGNPWPGPNKQYDVFNHSVISLNPALQ